MDREGNETIALEEESGFFVSPGYPLIYESDASAEYAIRTDPSKLLVVTFHDFQLERDDYPAPLPVENLPLEPDIMIKRSTLNEHQNHYGDPYPECVDYVKIIDIFDNHVETYCGRIPVFSYISRGNEILVQFKTDLNMNYRGFNASYRSISRRTPNDWELVYRVAKGGETEALDKFLNQDRGYSESDPNAKGTTITRSLATFKDSDVSNWENIGIRKVKVDAYKSGSIIATFRFDGQGTSLSSWFSCEKMTYSSYDDLNSKVCAKLVFALTDMPPEFEITTTIGNPRPIQHEHRMAHAKKLGRASYIRGTTGNSI
eukprot:XP_011666255.1 PREDICTED: uncharacterized protein LOC756781 [Strongylocentrotus purpuratus]